MKSRADYHAGRLDAPGSHYIQGDPVGGFTKSHLLKNVTRRFMQCPTTWNALPAFSRLGDCPNTHQHREVIAAGTQSSVLENSAQFFFFQRLRPTEFSNDPEKGKCLVLGLGPSSVAQSRETLIKSWLFERHSQQKRAIIPARCVFAVP